MGNYVLYYNVSYIIYIGTFEFNTKFDSLLIIVSLYFCLPNKKTNITQIFLKTNKAFFII